MYPLLEKAPSGFDNVFGYSRGQATRVASPLPEVTASDIVYDTGDELVALQWNASKEWLLQAMDMVLSQPKAIDLNGLRQAPLPQSLVKLLHRDLAAWKNQGRRETPEHSVSNLRFRVNIYLQRELYACLKEQSHQGHDFAFAIFGRYRLEGLYGALEPYFSRQKSDELVLDAVCTHDWNWLATALMYLQCKGSLTNAMEPMVRTSPSDSAHDIVLTAHDRLLRIRTERLCRLASRKENIAHRKHLRF